MAKHSQSNNDNMFPQPLSMQQQQSSFYNGNAQNYLNVGYAAANSYGSYPGSVNNSIIPPGSTSNDENPYQFNNSPNAFQFNNGLILKTNPSINSNFSQQNYHQQNNYQQNNSFQPHSYQPQSTIIEFPQQQRWLGNNNIPQEIDYHGHKQSSNNGDYEEKESTDDGQPVIAPITTGGGYNQNENENDEKELEEIHTDVVSERNEESNSDETSENRDATSENGRDDIDSPITPENDDMYDSDDTVSPGAAPNYQSIL